MIKKYGKASYLYKRKLMKEFILEFNERFCNNRPKRIDMTINDQTMSLSAQARFLNISNFEIYALVKKGFSKQEAIEHFYNIKKKIYRRNEITTEIHFYKLIFLLVRNQGLFFPIYRGPWGYTQVPRLVLPRDPFFAYKARPGNTQVPRQKVSFSWIHGYSILEPRYLGKQVFWQMYTWQQHYINQVSRLETILPGYQQLGYQVVSRLKAR